MHDFHQEVTFKQNFYLHQQFMCLCVVYVCFIYFFFLCVCGGGVCVCVCVCLDYSKTNEQIFI